MTEVVVENDQEVWDEKVIEKGGHPLQLWAWGEVKRTHGWDAERVIVRSDGETVGMAQLLMRHLPGPFKALVYVPRGPVCDVADREVVLDAISEYVQEHHPAVVLTIEPDWEEVVLPEDWRPSPNTILIPRTLIIDLAKSEDELMAVMAKKTRQYIRKSGSEVEIRHLKSRSEIDEALDIYRETAKRAGFALHGDDYYHDIFEKMGDYSPVFAAFKDGKMVAFLWLTVSGTTAFELYGGVNDAGQESRANYALKWHAIKTMQKWGLRRYDLNGLLNDGISTFKQSFSDHENKLIGTYDKPLSSLYTVWTYGLPWVKRVVRAIKNR
jgi:lipid II:glycine glycyltransferase (peptidoglycan interpeptide bridge formation enzyme)